MIAFFIKCAIIRFKWTILVVAATVLFFIWWRRKSKMMPKSIIPSISAIPFLTICYHLFVYGPAEKLKKVDTSDYLLQVLSGLCEVYRKDKIFQASWAGSRYIICCDPSTSEKVFQSSAAINKDWLYKLLHPWLGMGLVTSEDDKWRSRRKMLTPAFHFRILQDFLSIFNERSKILVGNVKKLRGDVVNITSVVALCTLDIIAETAMGVSLNSQEGGGSEYVKAVKGITSSVMKSFTVPLYWIKPLHYLSSTGREMRKHLATVHNFAREVIRNRKQKFLEEKEYDDVINDFQEGTSGVGMKKRRAFLDLLLYHHLTYNSLSEEDIREEVDTFMFAGHDTTSMALSWTLYLLGWHKDIQEKVYQELLRIYGDDRQRKVKVDDLKEMKYLERVIKETLRLFPATSFIIRRTSKDIEADEYLIPAKSSVVVYIYSIHRDPSIYPNPEIFDPDRFLPENSAGRHPFAYVPFSAGSRNCIGQRFAMMEVKTILAYLLRNFTIQSLDQRDKFYFVADIVLRPNQQLRLILNER